MTAPSLDTLSVTLHQISITPLVESDIALLIPVLWDDRVYEHIGGRHRDVELFSLSLRRALAGPPASRPTERWLNYAMRLRDSGQLIGRLEATVHDGIAEVAFLLGADLWGRGYATEGLAWLHREIARVFPDSCCWATTVPANQRCDRLLRTCGYARVDPSTAPDLMTYDDGDWVYRLSGDVQGG